jgi:hypothetical protein
MLLRLSGTQQHDSRCMGRAGWHDWSSQCMALFKSVLHCTMIEAHAAGCRL